MLKQRKRIWGMLLALATFAAGVQNAFGHSQFSSAGYIGKDDVQSSGGNASSSASYQLVGVTSQSGVEALSSGSYSLRAGFLHPGMFTTALTPTPAAPISRQQTLRSLFIVYDIKGRAVCTLMESTTAGAIHQFKKRTGYAHGMYICTAPHQPLKKLLLTR
jgi:hypothetical protein